MTMTMRPTKKTPSQILSTASLEDVLQCLAYVQRRRARDEVLQGLLQTRLARLTSDAPATTPATFLTVPEAGRRLKLSRPRIYELVRAGKLPKVPGLGKQVRIPSSALTAQKRLNRADSDAVL